MLTTNQLIDELEDIADSMERLRDLSSEIYTAAKDQTPVYQYAYQVKFNAKELAFYLSHLLEAIKDETLEEENEDD